LHQVRLNKYAARRREHTGEKSLGGDGGRYRLHGGRRAASATVAVEAFDAATTSTRRDDRRDGFSKRRRGHDQRGDTANATSPQRRQPSRKRRHKDGCSTAMELRRGETSWSHRDDELRRRTATAAARPLTDDRQLRAVQRRRRSVPHCEMPGGIHSNTTRPTDDPGGSLPSRHSTRARCVTAFCTVTLSPLSTSENPAQTTANNEQSALFAWSVQFNT